MLENKKYSKTELVELVKQRAFFKNKEKYPPREHSKKIDRLLGIKVSKIEQSLLKKYPPYYKTDNSGRKKHNLDTQLWIGLHPQVLQTPYVDIVNFLEQLEDFKLERFVDLGAGYGRIGVVLGSIFPAASFIGYELLDKRIQEGIRSFDRFELSDRCTMAGQDILARDFEIPQADVYFIYDFSNKDDLRVILNQLCQIGRERDIFLVTKGKWSTSLIQNSYSNFTQGFNPLITERWSIFSNFVSFS
ncbi:SAM-dependent methyltransferase [Bacteriovorax sp. Seq25_V]|uniref:SAM-dependent methyltransferase n=1 Tax=Bacteriovorax sp. Seq25_V TaxID=1201288 RepID=UPI00038A14D1|nr:SAM-dependent methyltransferase [Bacteriovorax sp. Seq25_V]EQC44179.1 hypothetical protein M900_A0407 [Bacteriovorax sp. Seq25_V]